MHDALDLLRAHCEPAHFPMLLPSEDDLLDIQEQLLIHIPRELREFLLHASDIVLGSLEPITASDPGMHTYLPEVASLAWEQGLPRHLLPLCAHIDGYYAVQQDDEVVNWSLHTGELLDEYWETVWDWACECWLGSHVKHRS